ncbi:MAG: HAD family hydrolase [Porcipelethomonas sp.]
MKINGVIFDMDGLLLDTEKLLMKFWIRAADFYGFDMKKEHVLGIRSLAAKYAEPKLKGIFGEDFDYHAVRQKRIELMNSHISRHGIEKKKGVNELLDYLTKNGYKKAVATATDYARTKIYLESSELFHYFDEIICGPMVENGKPAPDIYLKASQMLDLPPEECMALEDSPNGILSAYRAGCIPVMIPDLSEPDEKTIKLIYSRKNSLEEVIPVLEELNK